MLFVSFGSMRWHVYLFMLFAISIQAQQLELKFEKQLQADQFIGVDPYNNYYFIKDNVFHKKGPDGALVFSDFQLGALSSIDIINPLKIALFYESVNTVVFLDNKLNEIERINFNIQSDLINSGTVTNAGNNRLWVFNVDTQQLELFNYRSQNKTIVSQPFSGEIIAQASNFNYCFLLTEHSLRAFNSYGSFLFETNISGFEKIVQQNEKIIGLKENELFYITENSINPLKIPISENKIKDLQLTQDLLYIYDGINILAFSLTQPKQ